MSNFDLILDAFVFSIIIIISLSLFTVIVSTLGLLPIFIVLFIVYLLLVHNNSYLKMKYNKSNGLILSQFDKY